MEKNIGKLTKVFLLILLGNTFLAAQKHPLADLVGHGLEGQKEKYWVVFRDKGVINKNRQYVSEQTLKNRRLLGLPLFQVSDVPVAKAYIGLLKANSIVYHQQSKWLNAVSVKVNARKIKWLKKQPFIREVVPVATKLVPASQTLAFPSQKQFVVALEQMKAKYLVKQKLTAKGVKIGIIDVGFDGANRVQALKHVFKEKRFLGGKDFVEPRSKKIFRRHTADDYHGSQVWKAIAGKTRQKQFGLATKAAFYLARTDHGVIEARTEEDNWIAAVEWMDSLGVRVINTSLGYSDGFTNKKEDYKPSEMNGKTSKISQAADIAVKEKGLVVIVAAGNEGNIESWMVVSTPGDSKEAISVGATNARSRTKAGYSSIGPVFLPYLKPNISCFSSNGTSFSAPIIAGLAACLLQKQPSLKNTEIRDIMEKSAHLYPYGNNYIGYGVPQVDIALRMLDEPDWKPSNATKVQATTNIWTLKDVKAKRIVAFHKRNQYMVVAQRKMKVSKDGTLKVKRHRLSTRTTLDLGDRVIEIFWK